MVYLVHGLSNNIDLFGSDSASSVSKDMQVVVRSPCRKKLLKGRQVHALTGLSQTPHSILNRLRREAAAVLAQEPASATSALLPVSACQAAAAR